MAYAKPKGSTSRNIYDRLFEQIKQLTHTNTQQEPPVNNLNYPEPVTLTHENDISVNGADVLCDHKDLIIISTCNFIL